HTHTQDTHTHAHAHAGLRSFVNLASAFIPSRTVLPPGPQGSFFFLSARGPGEMQPHSKKVMGSIPACAVGSGGQVLPRPSLLSWAISRAFLCGVCMFSPC